MSPRRPVRHPELGAALRRAREAVTPKLSGLELSRRLEWNQAKVSLLEAGRQTPKESDIVAWAEATGADLAALLGERERALTRDMDIRAASRQPGGVEALQSDLGDFELASTLIAEYQPIIVPGLAQTADYTRAWLMQPERVDLGGPFDPDEVAALRAERQQQVIGHRNVVVALPAAALTAVYGTVDVQRAQLDALATAAQDGKVEVVVAPQPPAIIHGFELLDDAVIVETVANLRVMSEPSVVARFRAAMARLRRRGLTGKRAIREIERARERL